VARPQPRRHGRRVARHERIGQSATTTPCARSRSSR
jgi:hypothetical protein